MAEGAVEFLLEQLKWVTMGHRDLISGAERDFEQLTDEFLFLRTFLKKMVKEEDGRRNSMWYRQMKEIRDVIYEVEDTIGIGLTKANKAHHKATNLSRLAIRVRSIREDIVLPLIGKISDGQGFADAAGAMEHPQAISRWTPVPLIRQKGVVGFEDEQEKIIGYLKEKKDHLDVISIVGMPGLGKTTLAWKIYQSDDVGSDFSILIWVYIPQSSFDIRNVFLQILRKFPTSQDTSYVNDDELAQIVRVHMERERFLLVLDDVWSVDAWDQIKEVLPFNNGEGKVLITTQDSDVGMITSVYRKPHKLRFLNRDESWRLLQYEAFWDSENYPQELSHVGSHIATKCHGVPLVIVVVGSILRYHLIRSPSSAAREWETVSKSVSEALQSYGRAQRINDAVGLSYQRLPEELRECFLYLGVFPEAYDIPAKMLCRLWISEGFLFPRNGTSLEETAEENMNHLISRNLLAVVKTNETGKVKACRVHVMIRAFCIHMSRDENFYPEIEISKQGASEPSSSRRLCFSLNLARFLSENPCGRHVRSFLCFYEEPFQLEPQYMSVIPDGFEKLRILESTSIIFNQFPAKVVKLFHLRYLTLNIETILVLPKAIAQLWNLQTLVVETKSRSITMKANMWRMFQLRCLKTRAVIVLYNEWEGEAGENLHTLSRVAAESCTQAVSTRLKNLKTLGISGKLACIFQTGFLDNLHALEKLKLENRIDNGLPQRNCFPPNLKRLTLSNTRLGWKHMPTLAMIKSLESLKLRENAFVGALWRVDGYNFPSLQHLLMVNINLMQWEASTDAFPFLRFLEVNSCENLREIPKCVGRHLEKLEVCRVRVSVVESAMRIAKTSKERTKGEFGALFNLSIGAVWRTQLFQLECNILFGEPHK